MRTALVQTYGSPDTLTIETRPRPEPGPTGVLVRVHASPVTQGDRRIRAGDFPGLTALPGRLAMGWSGPRDPVPGSMFAGVVEAVGHAVTRFQPGDRVFGASMAGAHADLLVIDERKAVARIPDGVDFAEAAAVPFGAGTALAYLRDLGAVQPGERVLVIGAAGGVGRYAVQVARHLGAHVTAVARRAQAGAVRALGAHAVLVREDVDWREADQTWDVVFDTSDAFRLADARPSLPAEGRFLTLVLNTWRDLWDLVRSGLTSGPTLKWTVCLDSREGLEAIAALLASGAIQPVLGPRFPLERLADAHRALESRRTEGDVVIDVVAPEPRPVAALG